ncbi:MAG: hypothetical protein LBS21_04540 [Clostridiales bacterium]|jgi:uncharacterized protein YukE|nr:hypothetical protein [Clostridiales bacterium]
MATIQFDEGRADGLKADLGSCIGEVNASLDKMGSEVSNIKDWWKGGSEDGFIENFNKTKSEIQKALNECAAEYQKLVDKIKQIKQEAEKSIKAQLSK